MHVYLIVSIPAVHAYAQGEGLQLIDTPGAVNSYDLLFAIFYDMIQLHIVLENIYIYSYTYVCIYVFMYVCMYVYIYICIHLCMYVCMYVCVCYI